MLSTADTILELERTALDRWGKGDPDAFLHLSATDISYFDPGQERPLRNIAELTALYAAIRGKIRIDRSEIVNPRVQELGDAAVLSYQFFSYGSEGLMKWNATEVYHRRASGWCIVHTHWSFVQPQLARE